MTPKVREVAVTSAPARSAARQSQPQQVQPTQSPTQTPGPAPKTQKTAETTPTPRTVESAPQKVTGYATIGVTWKHGVTYAEDQIKIQIRTFKTRRLVELDEGRSTTTTTAPTATPARRSRPGSAPAPTPWSSVTSTRSRCAPRPPTARVPPDLKLAVIDPGTGKMTKQAPAIDTSKLPSAKNDDAGDGQPQASGTMTRSRATAAPRTPSRSARWRAPPKPYIYSRAQWGANEKMREQTAPSYGTVKTGFVHHTVNANNYTAAQVPALLRGIYAYHTQSRGWRDIGYNYLVDRFGRIWEGRWGGVDRAVVGAHTLGYNEVSFAMSAIGNFDIARPPQAVLDAYARLFAWKLSIYNIPANQTSILVKGRRLQRDQRSPRRRTDGLSGPISVRQARPGSATKARADPGRGPERRRRYDDPDATPPPVFTSPTQTARAAVAQPSTIKFPRSLNLAGSAYPDIVMRDYAGIVKLLATGGQAGYRAVGHARGPWRSMTLLAAVNDVTGDGKGDVLGRIGGGVDHGLPRRRGRPRVQRRDRADHDLPSGQPGGRLRATTTVTAATTC